MRRLTEMLPGPLRRRVADVIFSLKTYLRWIFRRYNAGDKHRLPKGLVVSLTSYPPRYGTLEKTLKTLLTQSIRANKVILWVAHSDYDALPSRVLELKRYGLDIYRCDDLRSYKKIIPALELFRSDFIVTADDDVYYQSDWLEGLTRSWSGKNEVIFHRGHEIRLDEKGYPLPYDKWLHEVQGSEASDLYFPTGMGGIMYPPGSLHESVIDRNTFLSLCPGADDVWLYFMARIQGFRWRRAGNIQRFRAWYGTEATALMISNILNGENDRQIKAMVERYGFAAEERYPNGFA